jgi:hypothetical protein
MAGRIRTQKRSSPSGGTVPRARFAISFFRAGQKHVPKVVSSPEMTFAPSFWSFLK